MDTSMVCSQLSRLVRSIQVEGVSRGLWQGESGNGARTIVASNSPVLIGIPGGVETFWIEADCGETTTKIHKPSSTRRR